MFTEEGRWAWVRAPETIKTSEFFAGQTLKELCKANAGDAKKLVKLRQWQNDFSSEFEERFDVPLSELLD